MGGIAEDIIGSNTTEAGGRELATSIEGSSEESGGVENATPRETTDDPIFTTGLGAIVGNEYDTESTSEQALSNKELIFGTLACIDIKGVVYQNPEAAPSDDVCQLCSCVHSDLATTFPPGQNDTTTIATTKLGEIQFEYKEETESSDSGNRELGALYGLRNEGRDAAVYPVNMSGAFTKMVDQDLL